MKLNSSQPNILKYLQLFFDLPRCFLELVIQFKKLSEVSHCFIPKLYLHSTASISQLFSDIKKIKSFLQDVYNLSIFLALTLTKVQDSDSLIKAAHFIRGTLLVSYNNLTALPLWNVEIYSVFTSSSQEAILTSDVKPKLLNLPRDIWKLTEPETGTSVLPTEIKNFIKKLLPDMANQIDMLFE